MRRSLFSFRALLLSVLVLYLGACRTERLLDEAALAPAGCLAPVPTGQGLVVGADAEDVCVWKGVPFANSGPEYRFRRPGPAPLREGLFDAGDYGAACEANLLGFVAPNGTAEDCLNLNIWASAGEKKLPVMVFLHGGAFLLGSGSWMVYDGAQLARNDVVVVTINYRLGPLGFFSSPAQQASEPDGASGNWGIWDQVAALRWVRENIVGFGGDPANVTVFGESAGGYSVCTLLAAPAAKGLFHRAIIESGGCLVTTAEEQKAHAATFLAAAGCDEADDPLRCIRGADVDDVNVFQSMWKGNAPTIDGVLLKEQPLEALRAGRGHAVPLLVGANREELRPVTLIPSVAWDLSASRAAYWSEIESNLSAHEASLLKALYPSGPGMGTRELWLEMVNDLFFRCSVAWSADAHSKVAPVYAYEFDIGERKTWAEKQMGAYHSLELPYVFGFLAWQGVMNQGRDMAKTAAYSRRMQAYWTRFARNGDPNTPGEPTWRPFADGRTVVRLLPQGNAPIPRYRQDQCTYWQEANLTSLGQLASHMIDFSEKTGVSLGFLDW